VSACRAEDSQTMDRVQVLLLGRFEVCVGEHPVPAAAWRQRRARDLVKLLALAPDHRLHRERAIDALWAELPPEAGAANLYKAAHHARAAMGSREAIVLLGGQVRLWPGTSVEVDAERFAATAEAALRTGSTDGCARAAAEYDGELLPEDRYEQWVQEPRERLRLLYLELLRGAGLWDRLVAEEPTDESAHQALMRGHLAAGNARAALSQFHVLRATLARELGVAPSPESLELYQRTARAPLRNSPVRYVRRDDVSIAYQPVAGGPRDLLLVPGWISHLALDWEEPRWLEWCERVTSFARLIRFDKRGTGLSDRPSGEQPFEERMEDARAVLDAAGVERAHVMGWSEGGALAVLLAVTYPERVRSLILYGTQACYRKGPSYRWGSTREEAERDASTIEETWGEGNLAEIFTSGADEAFGARWEAYCRAGASPATAAQLYRSCASSDVRPLLGRLRVPTLVLHRHGDLANPVEAGRDLAARIPGAQFVELDGEDHLLWLGDPQPLCQAIERFVTAYDDPPRSLQPGLEPRKVLGRSAS
jgi:DNA-binding SARP family transcriptional activator/pimeloyl-ACP methyl ester carboxylesterase